MLRPLLPALLLATPSIAEVPRTVADIAPVQSLVAAVMGKLGSPELLIPQGASPHDHAMSPSEARNLQDADLVFWIGPNLAPGLEDKINTIAEGAQQVTLGELDVTSMLPMRKDVIFATQSDDQHDHDDHDDHDHAEAHSDGHGHGHDHEHHGTEDPHVWLSPENAIAWLQPIADALTEADPENADTYSQNAEQARADIEDAVANANDSLKVAHGQHYVVFHDAYQYFETTFGLEVLGALRLSDASAPSPAQLDALRDRIEDAEIACAFAEPQFDPRLLETVTEGTGLPVAELDPLGTKLELGAGLYPALVTDLAQRIATCAN
ncbi:zinc transporter [Salipiger pallidus]|uniref:High-affinity zinc uptake system protein ZnuA n=1 Tax=Salipiger pallidus TaxID=1775170 RepID=A0A8J2ZHD2_9RHOB|nr:zinc ABC transporter substrate-binding protein [Salipiger pallidus]GGG62917.1 zinc transporter [Salipiger pallidus]